MLKQYCCTPPFILFCPRIFALNLKVFYIVHKVYVFHLNMKVTNLHDCTFNFTSTFVWSKCIPSIANMNAITVASDTIINRHQSIFLTPQSYLCYMDKKLEKKKRLQIKVGSKPGINHNLALGKNCRCISYKIICLSLLFKGEKSSKGRNCWYLSNEIICSSHKSLYFMCWMKIFPPWRLQHVAMLDLYWFTSFLIRSMLLGWNKIKRRYLYMWILFFGHCLIGIELFNLKDSILSPKFIVNFSNDVSFLKYY